MEQISLKLSLRLLLGDKIAIGPGKANLLEAIHRTGSISQAAKSLDMSYRRAWQLVNVMNSCFKSPLIETQKGGTHGGGAAITPIGLEILDLYRIMQQKSENVIHEEFSQLSSYLKSKN